MAGLTLLVWGFSALTTKAVTNAGRCLSLCYWNTKTPGPAQSTLYLNELLEALHVLLNGQVSGLGFMVLTGDLLGVSLPANG